MGIVSYFKNIPKALDAVNRQTLTRQLVGMPAKSKGEAILGDTLDGMPVLGTYAEFRKFWNSKGNRVQQLKDSVISVIPFSDFIVMTDTNLKEFESHKIKKMGSAETILTGKFIDNAIVKYIGGDKSIKSILHD
ncbi:MAG: hypothetical protein INQ03_13755 [Candidatus Heimdallarchaeota archaeon]|nr:hypothetical protein [Candidatus Heimdallarchaeota archaeon]